MDWGRSPVVNERRNSFFSLPWNVGIPALMITWYFVRGLKSASMRTLSPQESAVAGPGLGLMTTYSMKDVMSGGWLMPMSNDFTPFTVNPVISGSLSANGIGAGSSFGFGFCVSCACFAALVALAVPAAAALVVLAAGMCVAVTAHVTAAASFVGAEVFAAGTTLVSFASPQPFIAKASSIADAIRARFFVFEVFMAFRIPFRVENHDDAPGTFPRRSPE